MGIDRDVLGRIVRDAWIAWAKTQPDPKPSWLVPYDELSEPDKEADRQIGEAVRRASIGAVREELNNYFFLVDRLDVIRNRADMEEFEQVQRGLRALARGQVSAPAVAAVPSEFEAVGRAVDGILQRICTDDDLMLELAAGTRCTYHGDGITHPSVYEDDYTARITDGRTIYAGTFGDRLGAVLAELSDDLRGIRKDDAKTEVPAVLSTTPTVLSASPTFQPPPRAGQPSPLAITLDALDRLLVIINRYGTPQEAFDRDDDAGPLLVQLHAARVEMLTIDRGSNSHDNPDS